MGVKPVWMYIVDVVLAVGIISLIVAVNRRRRAQAAGLVGKLLACAFVVLGVMALGFSVWTWVQVFTNEHEWRSLMVAGIFAVALTYVYWMVLGKQVRQLIR